MRTCNEFLDVPDGDLLNCGSEALWGQGTLSIVSKALRFCSRVAFVSGCE